MGRALLEAEDWGGFRVLHTSGCIYSDEEGDEDPDDAQSGTRYVSLSAAYHFLSRSEVH
jgi:hypothetical protein